MKNVKIEKFDDGGLGLEPNNIAAINSLIIYRALRYGRHLDLLLTDERSYRGPNPFEESSTDKLADWADYGMFPDDLLQVLDGGRAFNGGNPPAELEFNGAKVDNPNKDKPPQTILGGDAEGVVQGSLAQLGRDLEDLGQFAMHPGAARRSGEFPGRADQAEMASGPVRQRTGRGLRQRLGRAQRDLRPGP